MRLGTVGRWWRATRCSGSRRGDTAISNDLKSRPGQTRRAAAAHYKKMYDRVSSLARIGVWECDLATSELIWTDTVFDLFDFPRGSAIDRTLALQCYDASSRREMERLRSQAIETGIGFSLDIRIRTFKGNPKWIRLTLEVEQEGGRPARIFGTKQDITAQRAAESKVQSLQTELIHISRLSAMNTMGSTLAHEVNQPLTAISSYMAAARRLAARQKVAPELAQCLDATIEAALRAGEIIRRTREMSAKGHAATRDVDVEPLVKEAVALATAGHPNATVKYELGTGISVPADPIQIQQVLMNLVQNACESAAGEPCSITIATALTKTHLEVCVSDTGAGIPPDVLPKIFDSFVTSKECGLGLGLSISRTIVEAHGGQIRAENLPHSGASFTFSLPLSRD